MKLIACIFTILTLLFMAQPYIVRCQQKLTGEVVEAKMLTDNSKNKCTKSQEEKQTQEKDCDTAVNCKLSTGCTSCHYLATGKVQYNSLEASSIKLPNPTSEQNTLAGFITDCWNPPEMMSC